MSMLCLRGNDNIRYIWNIRSQSRSENIPLPIPSLHTEWEVSTGSLRMSLLVQHISSSRLVQIGLEEASTV